MYLPSQEWHLAGLAAVRAAAPVMQQLGRIPIVGPTEFISLELREFEELERDYLFLARYLVLSGAPVEYGLRSREEPLARSYSPSERRTIRVDAEEADQWPLG